MERYRNVSGDSGVAAYEIGDDYVAVRFKAGVAYWYTEASVGVKHVAALKRLARRGQGLSTYISQHPDVSGGYERKDPDD
ncbi:hypothetical protein ACOCG7_27850 [Paraburkholderia sp. DD10]|uniref:hypothetical protein n=1 Tax=Paraburkholderia TaxID=1822464 RepID=UPI0009F24249|nr:hypothetical protein [Paraburkholderia terricola]AXE93531.1 hypothetical protein CUJ90_15295 [Paraburkholderia terricola]ORC48590.1 hypothetical protein B2G74_10620 [Burkholderia sp. A27]